MRAISLMILMLLITGCAMTVSEVDKDKANLVGEKITVKGMVGVVVKIGPISGYELKDDVSSIKVSSQNLPKEGDQVTVSGVWMKDTLLGYYLKAEQ